MSKKIIKDQQIIDDSWCTVADDEALPEGSNVIVSHQRWQQQKQELVTHNAKLGIIISEDILAQELKDDLSKLALIAIEFPEFKDGRGYSTARLLRERYGYTGELRATGNILRDQLYYLYRCGFDAFELDNGRDLDDALNAFGEYSVHYQAAAN